LSGKEKAPGQTRRLKSWQGTRRDRVPEATPRPSPPAPKPPSPRHRPCADRAW
jgi:hypothetical protein